MTQESNVFEMWAVLELMGHRRLAGFVSEASVGGASFIRIDIPEGGEGEERGPVTQFYAPSAVYAITPTTEAIARAMASRISYKPISAWELQPAIEAPRRSRWDDDEDDGDEYDEEDYYQPRPQDGTCEHGFIGACAQCDGAGQRTEEVESA